MGYPPFYPKTHLVHIPYMVWHEWHHILARNGFLIRLSSTRNGTVTVLVNGMSSTLLFLTINCVTSNNDITMLTMHMSLGPTYYVGRIDGVNKVLTKNY